MAKCQPNVFITQSLHDSKNKKPPCIILQTCELLTKTNGTLQNSSQRVYHMGDVKLQYYFH